MAYADRATREVVTTKTENVIRLDLSESEAETLAVVLSRVGGSPYRSPRGNAENILDALTVIIGDYRNLPVYKLGTGAINFADVPNA